MRYEEETAAASKAEETVLAAATKPGKAKKAKPKAAKKSAKRAAKPAKKPVPGPVAKGPKKKRAPGAGRPPGKSKAAKKGRAAKKKALPYHKRGPGSPNKIVRRGDKVYGAKVAKARARKGLTQAGLAAKVKVRQPQICNVEKGTVAASFELQRRIKKALGVAMTRKE